MLSFLARSIIQTSKVTPFIQPSKIARHLSFTASLSNRMKVMNPAQLPKVRFLSTKPNSSGMPLVSKEPSFFHDKKSRDELSAEKKASVLYKLLEEKLPYMVGNFFDLKLTVDPHGHKINFNVRGKSNTDAIYGTLYNLVKNRKQISEDYGKGEDWRLTISLDLTEFDNLLNKLRNSPRREDCGWWRHNERGEKHFKI